MEEIKSIERPAGIDWDIWIDRWDQMQNRYIAKRSERFETIIQVIKATQTSPARILDIGCGTGSLSLRLLESFPKTEIFCVDVDPTMLWLAETMKRKYGERVHIRQHDLRDSSCVVNLSFSFDAIVSATALHWLNQDQLVALYRQIYQKLNPGGVFLNADHVGSGSSKIQNYWEKHRDMMRGDDSSNPGGDWDSFWAGYAKALGVDVSKIRDPLFENRETGPEEGLPLSWHLNKLHEVSFAVIDCFWRCDSDAIYGGLKNLNQTGQTH